MMNSNQTTIYDLIIIGGSAAATTAGIYAARRNLNFKIITKDFGGEVATSGHIGNWPGIVAIDGFDLSEQFKKHLEHYNILSDEGIEVTSIKKENNLFCISSRHDSYNTQAGTRMQENQSELPKCDYISKAVIIATGVHPRELTVPGEKEHRNKGVSYCTVCDGPIFRDKITAVVGGGNSALEAALMLADLAKKVYIINKNPEFKGEHILIDNINKKSNVEILFESTVSEIYGTTLVEGLKYKDKQGVEKDLAVDGIFVHIGMIPNSHIASSDIDKNEYGEIKIDKYCQTNVPGLFAAGDVTDVPYKQIVIAAGQGCIALLSVVAYINRS